MLSLRSAQADDGLIGKKFISHDGKYSCSLQFKDSIRNLEIRNRKNHSLVASFEQNVVDSIEWSKSADAIFIINRMSGASDLIIISLRDGKWITSEYDVDHSNPKLQEYDKSFLYKYTVNNNIMKAYFAYTFENNWNKSNRDDSGVDVLAINLSTGKVEKTTNNKISFDEYTKLSVAWRYRQ